MRKIYKDFEKLIAKKYYGYIRLFQANKEGISTYNLDKMIGMGIIEKVGRGKYALKGYSLSEFSSMLEACKQVPSGVICLTTALAYYDLVDTIPYEVDVAIERKSRMPMVEYPPIRFHWYPKQIFLSGIDEIKKPEGIIRIYKIEKSIADSFKYWNKIGENIAIEALKAYLKTDNFNLDMLLHFSKMCRVDKIVSQLLKGIL